MERKIWSVLVVLLGVTALVGAGLTWANVAGDKGQWDETFLGPESERRNYESPREHFSMSVPAEWQIDTTPVYDAEQVARTALRPVLALDPPGVGSLCTVYVATDDMPTAAGCFPRDADESWGQDAWDRADQVIGPLTGEYECAPGSGMGTLRVGGPVSLSFRQPNGTLLVAYHFETPDRDYVLACTLTPWLPDGSRSEVPWPAEPFDANWAIQPIADTFEALPTDD